MVNIPLDTTVTFDLKDNRRATLDIGELQEFQEQLYETQAHDEPVHDAHGKPVMQDGKPVTRRILPWATIESSLTSFVKEKTGVVLTRWEARGLWDSIAVAWEKKRQSWRGQDDAKPTSSRSTAPESWD